MSKVPDNIQALQPEATWHRHKNGGGWVSSTVHVVNTVFIGPDAIAYGECKLTEGAKLLGESRVWGSAYVSGRAQVMEDARVYGNAKIQNTAVVKGTTHVFDRALVRGSAVVKGDAKVFGDSVISGTAWVKDNASIWGYARVGEDSYVSDHAKVFATADIKGVAHIYGTAEVSGGIFEGSTHLESGEFTEAPLQGRVGQWWWYAVGQQLTVGCESHTASEWLENKADLSRMHEPSTEQAAFITAIAEFLKGKAE